MYEHVETWRPDLEPSDNRRKRVDKRGARLQLVDAEAHEEDKSDKSDGARVSQLRCHRRQSPRSVLTPNGVINLAPPTF